MSSKRSKALERKSQFVTRVNAVARRLNDPTLSERQIDDWIEQGVLLKASQLSPRDCWGTENLRRVVFANHLKKRGRKRNDELKIVLWLQGRRIHERDLLPALLREYRRQRRVMLKRSKKDMPVGYQFDPFSVRGERRIQRLGPPDGVLMQASVTPGPDFLNMLYELARYSEEQNHGDFSSHLMGLFPLLGLLPQNQFHEIARYTQKVFRGSLDDVSDPERGLSKDADNARNEFEEQILRFQYHPQTVEHMRQLLVDLPRFLRSLKAAVSHTLPSQISAMIDLLIISLPQWPWPVFGAILIMTAAANGSNVLTLPDDEQLKQLLPFLVRYIVTDQETASSLRPITLPL